MCCYRMEVASGTKRLADTDKVNILTLVFCEVVVRPSVVCLSVVCL